MARFLRPLALCLTFLFGALVTAGAEPFQGKVSDMDAGGGYLTVNSSAKQKTETFKVTAETVIVGPDGKPSELMKLVEGTLVNVEAAGEGKVARKITVVPSPSQQVP